MQTTAQPGTDAERRGHPLGRTMQYFAAGMSDVSGFLTKGAAAAILTILEVQARDDIGGNIAEIGTFHGRTFIGLALALRQEERILGVDLFVHKGTDFEATLRENCRRHGVAEGRMRLHRGNSATLTEAQWRPLLGAPARFVHVDGEHTRAAVSHDLGLAASALAAGGVILADDMLHPWYPDVTAGVLEFLQGHPELRAVALIDRQGPLTDGGPKLLITAQADEARYKAALAAAMRDNLVKETSLSTSRPLVLGFDNGVRKRLLRLERPAAVSAAAGAADP